MGKIIRNGVTYGSTSNIAGNISYDNSSSDLISVTVQNAITELSRLIIDDGDVQQVDTMPAASEDKEGKVIQYIGDTNQYFTHNYFYECVSDGGDPATYTWQEVQVCAGVGRTEKDNSGNALGEYFNKYEDTESGGVTTHRNMATGEHSHAEGHGENTAGGIGSHVEGGYNTITAAGSFAHAENSNNTANAHSSHVEGAYNTANGTYSHVEGVYNTTAASSLQSHVEGNSNNAASATTHLEGTQNVGGSFINQSLAKTVIVSSLPSAASANTTTLYLLWDNNTHQYEAYKKVSSELVSQGYLTVIPGQSVHAEGQNNISAGGHIEGSNNVSRQGEVTNHVEGNNNYVDTNNINVHIEGAAHTVPAWSNTSNYDDKGGHIEGYKHQFAMTQQSSTVAPASYHIEGSENTIKDINWLNHNINTTDYGTSCHIEGHQNVSGGFATHTEGQLNSAFGDSAHAEGKYNKVDGLGSHVEGNNNIAYGHETHIEGRNNEVIVNPNGNDYDTKHFRYIHIEGENNIAGATGLHIEGQNHNFSASSLASNSQFAHIEGRHNQLKYGTTDILGAHAEGEDNTIGAKWVHAEGYGTTASGNSAHAEGYRTQALGMAAHAEGSGAQATGDNSHAEGLAYATGDSSHAEGFSYATGEQSHAEGESYADGFNSHAEGYMSNAKGEESHAEGNTTEATGGASHAEGVNTMASGHYSHAEGYHTVALGDGSHASGKYNDFQTGDLFEIGNGTDDHHRSNIVEVSETYLNVNGDIRQSGAPIRVTTMPTITASMVGAVVQYVGTTDSNYKQGWDYVAVSDGAIPPVYSWSPLMDITPTYGSQNTVTSGGIANLIRKGSTTNAVRMGSSTSSGTYTLSQGDGSTASGYAACAINNGKASGNYTFAQGTGTTASQTNMAAFGKYNSVVSGDLFEIGNGASSSNKSNILEVSPTALNVNGAIKTNGVAYSTPYTTMPTVTAAMVGQIAQYMGVTNSTYTRGQFYEAISDGAASPTYSWEPIAASGEDTSHFIGTTTEWTNVQDKSAYDGGIVVFTDDNDTVVGSLATTVTHGDLRAVTSDGVASALSEIVRPVAYRAYSNAGQTPLGLFARQYYDGRLIFHYRAGIRISNATPAVISFPASDDYDFYVNGSNPLEIAPPTKNSGFKQAWDQYVSTQNNIASTCVIFTPKSSSDPAYVSGDTTAESDITAVATVNRMQKNQDGTYSIYCAVQGNYIGPAYVDVLFDSF